jgi:hypothetical protein
VEPDSSAKVKRGMRKEQQTEGSGEPLSSISAGLVMSRRSLTAGRLPSEQALRRGRAMAG